MSQTTIAMMPRALPWNLTANTFSPSINKPKQDFSRSHFSKRRIFLFAVVILVGTAFQTFGATWKARYNARSITYSLGHGVDYKEFLERKDSKQRRVVVAQYTSANSSSRASNQYDFLIELTQPINQQYAERWGYDYFLFRGPPPGLATANPFPASRSTYFKAILLQQYLREQKHDVLVLLDADALFFDFDRDVLSSFLFDERVLLVAHPVGHPPAATVPEKNVFSTYKTYINLNIGVTVWNLRHPAIQDVTKAWLEACMRRIAVGARDDDQTALHGVLRRSNVSTHDWYVYTPPHKELAYGKGTFIKHFIRLNGTDWSDREMQRRLKKIVAVREEICPKYGLACVQA